MNMYLRKSDRTSPPVSVRFENCTVEAAGQQGISIGAMSPGTGAGGIGVVIDGLRVKNVTSWGLSVFDKAGDGPAVIVRNSLFEDVATNETIRSPCPPEYRKLKKCSSDRIVPLHPLSLTGGIEPKHPSTYAIGGLTIGPNVTVKMSHPNRSFLLMENIPHTMGFAGPSGFPVEGSVNVVVFGAATTAAACAIPKPAEEGLAVQCKRA